MANPMLEHDEAKEAEAQSRRINTQPMTIVRPAPDGGDRPALSVPSVVSYVPTQSGLVNRVLDITDRVTHGRAGLVQRVVTYLFFGGIAALVNLFVFYLLDVHTKASIAGIQHSHFAIAFACATEISIMANFIPQDRVTFSRLPGHSRSWLARCLRFHLTCVAGTLLTLAISFTLNLVHVYPTLGQAIALVIVTVFNFTAHHLFTYRHTKPQVL